MLLEGFDELRTGRKTLYFFSLSLACQRTAATFSRLVIDEIQVGQILPVRGLSCFFAAKRHGIGAYAGFARPCRFHHDTLPWREMARLNWNELLALPNLPN